MGSSYPQDRKDTSFTPYRGDMSSPNPSPNAEYISSVPSLAKTGNPTGHSEHDMGNTSKAHSEHYQRNSAMQQNWPSHQQQDSNPRMVASQQSNLSFDPSVQGYDPSLPRSGQELSSGNFSVPSSGGDRFSSLANRHAVPFSSAAPDLQGEQLANIASSFMGHANSVTNQSENQYRGPQSSTYYQNSPGQGEYLQQNQHQQQNQQQGDMQQVQSQLQQQQQIAMQQVQHPQQQQVAMQQVQQPQQLQQFAMQQVQPQQQQLQQQQGSTVAASSQQSQSGGSQQEDADPQRRLQATLQLAAALLKQIQQGKGT